MNKYIPEMNPELVVPQEIVPTPKNDVDIEIINGALVRKEERTREEEKKKPTLH